MAVGGRSPRYRRFLLDMHIPDWDPGFLSSFDPRRMAELYTRARVNSVMLYCQSHVGLCYWPARTGKVHAACRCRDLVKEMVESCRERGLEVFAYYSGVYNNQAYLDHPSWRIVPSMPMVGQFYGGRYGHVCPNNSEYRQFARSQIRELVERYPFDGFFIDMSFWPAICRCVSCRQKFSREAGAEIPDTINWHDEGWCMFQAARERWLVEYSEELTGAVKELRPDLPVYHNFATVLLSWTRGISFPLSRCSDFLGGDFYGDPYEQLLVSHLMVNLSQHSPVEFMTSRCMNLTDHVQTKSAEQLGLQALAATSFGAAFRFLDAVDPAGTVNPAIYDLIGEIYEGTIPYEEYLGGQLLQEVAVYVSDHSKMNFTENGMRVDDPSIRAGAMPHLQAVRGAVRLLQEAHLAFGVITRKQLASLDSYRLIILPDVLRMDTEEVDAFRRYVEGGGRLYASRYTSLTHASGTRHADFMLGDVFGCRMEGEYGGLLVYVQPREAGLSAAIAPQTCLTHPRARDGTTGTLKVSAKSDARVLATATLPYAAPYEGNVEDHNWASIHSSPPWEQTSAPVVIEHRAGAGQCIYSAADIETTKSPAHAALFLGLIKRLLDRPPSFEADAHPSVWITVSHQAAQGRYIICFLNYQSQLPVIPIPRLTFRLRLPRGVMPARLLELPGKREVRFGVERDGAVCVDVNDLERFRMLALQCTVPSAGAP